MSRVLVTGGLGFIGSHVVDTLTGDGYEVVVLDNVHPAAHREDPPRRDGVEYRIGDVTDPDAVAGALAGVTAVSHQAAMVGLGVDFRDAPGYAASNDLGTAVLLAGLHEDGFAGPLILASSMVVYGEGRYRCGRDGLVRPGPRPPERLEVGDFEPRCPACGGELVAEAVPEDQPADPRNVYAATKLHQEHLASAFAREHPGVVATALRYHNVYGPRMPRDTPYAGVAAIFRSAYAARHAPQVFEDGGQRRDFVHVADVARANHLALEAARPGTFNIATGAARTVLEMANALHGAFPGAPPPEVVGGWRPGDVRHVFASPEAARAGIGFVAEVPFDEGMYTFASAELRA